MDKIRIRGGVPLTGNILIGGAKNAALPLMTASLLTDQPLTLHNVPHLADIVTLANLLGRLGVIITLDGTATNGGNRGHVVRLESRDIADTTAPYDLVRKMRASILVLGPLLARCGQARVSLPGGCAIGTRPVDLHLKGFEAMGAEISLESGYIEGRCSGRLQGAEISFPFASVGATENLLMAAVLAEGRTLLRNVALEPEVSDLAQCLVAMGAQINGIGTNQLEIHGVEQLKAADHRVIADRIEIGTFIMAAAITDGDLTLIGAKRDLVHALCDVLNRVGIVIETVPGGLRARRVSGQFPQNRLQGVDVMTEPFPGFPTDLQAQFMAVMSQAQGASMITETIFENRFMHVPELKRLGANINVHGGSAMVRGVESLIGAPVMATDLRASVSLVLAGLAAKGETIINRVYHLDRGYERLEERMAACGADIERLCD